ncbi:MAG: TlpA family protein disulfide reductase [Chloroflexi bacterium]|nr:MAG: TlpA family protein disulfide reductase [Chloroflexota bacterium]
MARMPACANRACSRPPARAGSTGVVAVCAVHSQHEHSACHVLLSGIVHLAVVACRRLLSCVVLAAVTIVGTGCRATFGSTADSGPTIARPGAPAPDFSLSVLDGGTQDLLRERGNVVLLNFWATWCIPCREEMPELQRLADDLRGQQFTLLTIDLQEDAASINAFRTELGLRLPVLLDEDGEVTRSYGVRALPATFLIDQRGVLRQQRLGPLAQGDGETPWTRSWIARQVQAFLELVASSGAVRSV